MRKRLLVAMGALLSAALLAAPVRGWQVSAEDHAKHHPETQPDTPEAAQRAAPQAKVPAAMDMVASSAKLDELVKKMNAARGQAKVDAIAELLTVMVQTHQTMHGNMSTMMQNMGGTRGK